YEMAAYGTLVAWARAMGHGNAAGLLQQILDEEKATDEKLTTLGEGGVNKGAAGAAQGNGAGGDDDDEAEAPAARPRTSTAPAARRSTPARTSASASRKK